MASLLTHAAFGVILALALGIRGRWLVAGMLLAILPDLDHVLPGSARGPLHSIAFCLALPLCAAFLWRERSEGNVRLLLFAAPALLGSHLLLDLVPHPTELAGGVNRQRAPLFWPVDGRAFQLVVWRGSPVDPRAPSSFALLACALVGLALAARAFASPDASRARRAAVAVALVVALPIAATAGVLAPWSAHPDARLIIASVSEADGAIVIEIVNEGPADAWPESLVLELVSPAGTRSASNDDWVTRAGGWRVSFDSETWKDVSSSITLRAAIDDHLYDARP